MDEAEAIGRLKQGDIAGLERLVRQYYVPAVRAAILVTRDRPLAEDVAQSAFLRLFERIGSFDSCRRFAPWFLRLVVNAAVDAAKGRRRELSLDELHQSCLDEEELGLEAWLADPNPGPEETLEAAEMQAAVRAALDRLSPEQRAVVVLRYYLAWSEDEMAHALGSPRGTIKSRLNAARTHLRRWLRPWRPAGWLPPSVEPVPNEANPTPGGQSCAVPR